MARVPILKRRYERATLRRAGDFERYVPLRVSSVEKLSARHPRETRIAACI